MSFFNSKSQCNKRFSLYRTISEHAYKIFFLKATAARSCSSDVYCEGGVRSGFVKDLFWELFVAEYMLRDSLVFHTIVPLIDLNNVT